MKLLIINLKKSLQKRILPKVKIIKNCLKNFLKLKKMKKNKNLKINQNKQKKRLKKEVFNSEIKLNQLK